MSETDDLPETIQMIAEVVALQSSAVGVIPVEGTTPIDLDRDASFSVEVLGQLLDSCVRLIAPADVPYGLVEAIQRQPVPLVFSGSSWLSRHRALVFHDGQCAVEGYRMRYSRLFGVLID
ncbi:hypothetical protein [Planobispora takensis]|uniref:Cas3 C-terminal domain-containing protein n=1 Tax=Planobispora takensis TaxID=1367882 RepID=A0A8J3T377_9ACTN|nr:hypothetical protein [Planobispora takensis]GII05489.1 hypothetical protein Pta02_74970 [Planobispora takensis]